VAALTAVAVWAGIIVADLVRAVPWYAAATGATLVESSDRWAALGFADGSGIELHAGDPERPGLTFPSYRRDPGPPVMPGYSVDDAEEAAAGLEVARSLPGWLVVVAPGRLRIVLADRDSDPERGIVGFRYESPEPGALTAYLAALGAPSAVAHGATLRVVPLLMAPHEGEVADPEGNALGLVRRSPHAAA
jgi:catechol 2,3-dioxygenase-like lactoylglutathione lyase family enzyme